MLFPLGLPFYFRLFIYDKPGFHPSAVQLHYCETKASSTDGSNKALGRSHTILFSTVTGASTTEGDPAVGGTPSVNGTIGTGATGSTTTAESPKAVADAEVSPATAAAEDRGASLAASPAAIVEGQERT